MEELVDPTCVLQCEFCTYHFHTDLPHFACRRAHNNPNSNFVVCQACFFSWVHGEMRADNVGFRQRRCCGCQAVISHAVVQSVLDPLQFAEYDGALLRHALSKDAHVLHCPGVDCENAYFKPKRNVKRQCRKAKCEQCETEFCCLCGELYTSEHKRMKCGPYKKWKQEHDEDTKGLLEWRKAQDADEVKPCPGCKKDVEKTGGCNEMRCTNCNVHFCWACCAKFQRGNCEC